VWLSMMFMSGISLSNEPLAPGWLRARGMWGLAGLATSQRSRETDISDSLLSNF
jgi:hypothetical protein